MNRIYNDFKPETTALIERLQAAGFSIVGANDGEEFHKFADVAQTVGVLTSVDESHLYLRHDNNERRIALFLVYGNEPGELVCDYGIPSAESVAELLDAVTQAHCDEWSGKEQPTTTAPQASDF